MSAHLDLDDVCAGHPVALAELESLRRVIECAHAAQREAENELSRQMARAAMREGELRAKVAGLHAELKRLSTVVPITALKPGEHYHAYRSVVCLFAYRALHGIPFDVYRDYHRVFMYIDDLIPTFANVHERGVTGEVYNIGGVEYRSVEELAALVLRETGAPESLIQWQSTDAHNRKNKRPDVSKAAAALGHNPTVTLEEGIPRTVAWLRGVYGISNPGVDLAA